MVAAIICPMCRPNFFNPEAEPLHCHGTYNRPAPPGVLGGYRCACICPVEVEK